MGGNLLHANVETPMPDGGMWADEEVLSTRERALVADKHHSGWLLVIVAAKDDGQVIVQLNEPLSAGDRGTVLLDFEGYIQSAPDGGVTVWVEALGDRNSLRNLRGIEVKA